MLFKTPELDAQELAVISRIDEIRKALDYAVDRRRWTGNLRRMALAKAVRGSNSIEGYRVSVEDALAAVDDEAPLDAESETWLAVTGYRKAMSYVLQISDDPYYRFSRGVLCSLHYMMMDYAPTKNPGRWRPGAIYVRNEETGENVYEGPAAEHVNALMAELRDELNDQQSAPALVRAAMAHLNLVMIHPFSDGNGRMARCLQTLVLAREKILLPQFCSIEEYLGHKQHEYYDVLSLVGQGAWHPERDARPWVQFSLTAHYRQATNMLRWGRIYERLWDILEGKIKEECLPDRVIAALSDAALGYKVRNATYRKGAGVELVIAGRDLQAATKAGLLKADGEKRGRFYVCSESLHEITRPAFEPYVEQDPFAMADYLPGLAPI